MLLQGKSNKTVDIKNKFYPKVDWWVGILFGTVILFEIINIVKDLLNKPNISTLMGILVVIFCNWILFGTYYEFKKDYLLIKLGPFKEKLLYDEINKINFKKSIVASLALSADRIELICNGRFGSYVSPKNKNEFIEILKSKCANVKL